MAAREIKGLDQDGLRTLYGVNPVREAFRAGRKVTRLFLKEGNTRLIREVEASGRAERVDYLPADRLADLARSREHQGVVARVEAIRNTSMNHLVRTQGKDVFVLVLDGIQDPHNLGAILRVADGAGVDLVVVPSRKACSVQLGSVAKASAGAVEHVPLLVVGDLKRALKELAEHGFQRVALEAREGPALADMKWRFPVALVIGGEDSGVRQRHRNSCDGAAHIPLGGKVSSLNASVATGVAAFAVAAARRGSGT